LGDGFTKPTPYQISFITYVQQVISVTATDKYTVAFKWRTTNPEFILETMEAYGSIGFIESPDAVKQWGDLNDWHHAIGTGPFILKDFVSGSSATMVKNPNYYGFDEHYPQNQLPYIDTIKLLIIPDDATALAALRTGKIDDIDGMSIQTAQSTQKTNPEIVQIPVPVGNTYTIDPRNDKAPFSDIRVRKALQMAINLPSIAKDYFNGTAVPSPSTLTSNYFPGGWGFPYSQWPQDLKDEYAYNPTAAKQLLAQAGFPNGFKTNVVADIIGDMDLLQIVKSYFSAVGVDMEIRPMEDAAFTAFVVIGHKNDAFCYRLAGTLGATYYPIRQFSRFLTGASSNLPVVSDPVFEAFNTKALVASSTNEVKQLLRDANEYVARQHFTISLLQPMQYSLCQPWLKGFNAQSNALSGSAGPLMLFFFGARFWIDQNMKKSMGH
jgi:peptide/nickel transport system substrate-binding protein